MTSTVETSEELIPRGDVARLLALAAAHDQRTTRQNRSGVPSRTLIGSSERTESP